MTENENISVNKSRLEWALFLLRLGVFIVMLAWTLDKFLNTAHAAKIYEVFYFLDGMGHQVMQVIGAVELVIIFAFLAGMWKRYTYGIILILHGVSTLSSWQKYTTDISLLFFAAWPMLAACAALYMLRQWDVKYSLGK